MNVNTNSLFKLAKTNLENVSALLSAGPNPISFQTLLELKMAVFWANTLMMEAASTSETSVNFYQMTGCNNPKDMKSEGF
jgi:hypothetical protein